MKNFLGAVVVFFAIVYGVAYIPTAVTRAFDGETKLGLFEERISNIPVEFIRRSPTVAHSWKEFKECLREYISACDPTPILAERDHAISEEWPALFDRLAVFGDWGEYSDSQIARDRFFEVLAEKGADTLRNRCVPKITYTKLPSGGVLYNLEGYVCSPQPDHVSG